VEGMKRQSEKKRKGKETEKKEERSFWCTEKHKSLEDS
jgi:hypothetical protein